MNDSSVRLILFLYKNYRKRYSFSELREMGFFSNSTRLSCFLRDAVKYDVIKKTNLQINGKRYARYEIKFEANILAEWLEWLSKPK